MVCALSHKTKAKMCRNISNLHLLFKSQPPIIKKTYHHNRNFPTSIFTPLKLFSS